MLRGMSFGLIMFAAFAVTVVTSQGWSGHCNCKYYGRPKTKRDPLTVFLKTQPHTNHRAMLPRDQNLVHKRRRYTCFLKT
ncbi:hypothetical protein MAR_006124 [Mya arenaria]|uniref:Secreted protein n=1 Tax=Mya arenaria TaxID=6604 RepID=A0ABY7D9N2_MYAAR|nr:hypothetical protein MAR_006124 [Mya arenaria]